MRKVLLVGAALAIMGAVLAVMTLPPSAIQADSEVVGSGCVFRHAATDNGGAYIGQQVYEIEVTPPSWEVRPVGGDPVYSASTGARELVGRGPYMFPGSFFLVRYHDRDARVLVSGGGRCGVGGFFAVFDYGKKPPEKIIIRAFAPR